MFRFRLRTLMLLVLISALTIPQMYNWFHQRRVVPVGYTSAELARRLSDGQPVLVLFHASWNQESHSQLAKSHDEIWRFVRDNSVSVLNADCTVKGSQGERLMQQIGISRLPAFAIYSPTAPKSPVLSDTLADEASLRSALKASTPTSTFEAEDHYAD
ncbi:MAG: hypothetical protein Aurels2KO_29290 [Aureliella sp.]